MGGDGGRRIRRHRLHKLRSGDPVSGAVSGVPSRAGVWGVSTVCEGQVDVVWIRTGFIQPELR